MHQALVLQPKWIFFLLLLSCFSASAQPDFTLPLNKPEKYRNKELGAERTDAKKFTLPRRLFQGMITHYNYYYNANRKINEIVERAKLAHKDDYTELLPFYNFSTQITAGDSAELDSILYKATAGIVLHDTRNSYVDNLYQLIGKSYFYWRKFDSAHRIFQFINYNYFPKGKDEYIIVVGANENAANGQLKIATKENKNLVHRAFSQPPSRNEALFWLAKTYAEDSLYAEALSLTKLLRSDPQFPKRLHTQLDEVNAYVFYQQGIWDSTAFYLEKALVNAENKTELARWQYLLGQLYSVLKQPEAASRWFNKAKSNTTDPVLYIHARIYESQLVMNEEGNSVQTALNDLEKMSKRERFDGYEDVLFYAAGGMALQLKDSARAKILYQKSNRYNTEHASLKNKAFLKLATIAYGQADYEYAAACYDSLNLQDESLAYQAAKLELRRTILKELVKNIKTVQQQDSLQAIAKMPEKELDAYLKTLLKKLRKQRGLKEEEAAYTSTGGGNTLTDDQPVLATTGSGNAWYFNNAVQKSKGYNEFIARWGKRPNVDNWRRESAVALIANQPAANNSNPSVTKTGEETGSNPEEQALTIEGLKERLPLTEDKLKQSNTAILDALFTQGQIYKNQLEDYTKAAAVFEEIWKRFSNYPQEEQTLFELYYCYKKAGNPEKSEFFHSKLKEKFADSQYELMITSNGKPSAAEELKNRTYEEIYTLFIEGNFTEALTRKAKADSIYGKSYWTPQLLYIEALYFVRQRNDSAAINTLTELQMNFAGSAMAEKAAILKDVLLRRAEIEDYLTKTNIVRENDEVVIPFDEGPKVNKTDQQVKQQPDTKVVIQNKPAQVTAIEKPKPVVQKTGIDPKDKGAPKPSITNKPAVDSTRIKPLKDTKVEMAYVYNANEPYVVLMVFDKVDPVYISESKIAFQRYNNSAHAAETIRINIYEGAAEEYSWLDLGPYPDVASVLGYFDELKANAKQIVPWLPAAKYQFLVISEQNLELLKTRKNLEEYKLFIRQYIKDKF
ncbi:hypothetical protein PDL71_09000 [Lacibacter sp. MH-610]|uniref:type IX secretion system periplasmic lipoprotein PorW/SprE n=1 Tax=Lacibacter sp. MH-610 TaxID=3020883 RepID=UPI003891C164